MKINGLTPVYFDIETTGFSAFDDSFVCATSEKQGKMAVFTDLPDLMNNMQPQDLDKYNDILITYNGENYRGGFDFPWLRSKCIQQDIDWQLGGVKHLDLLPLVRKYLNTTGYEAPSKSDLYSDDIKKLADANDIEYSTKYETYEELTELENIDWLDYEMQPNEDNSLQSVYQKLFDPEQEEDYIDGERIPELYNRVLKLRKEGYTDDDWQVSDLLDDIYNHNRRDVERLKKVAEKVIPVLPDWEVQRNINKL